MTRSIAYFVSPHGFGHAARAAAVMNALAARDATVHFHIFTRVPRWFFAESLRASFTYHACLTDIGLVQDSALKENLPQTLERLREFFPFNQSLISNLAHLIMRHQCRAVLCDIAPLGIAVARAAGVPSVLIENFTWDWITRVTRATMRTFTSMSPTCVACSVRQTITSKPNRFARRARAIW
jgi:UDP:flavonoid glycosyltransferase YjiC (YdhE family)